MAIYVKYINIKAFQQSYKKNFEEIDSELQYWFQ